MKNENNVYEQREYDLNVWDLQVLVLVLVLVCIILFILFTFWSLAFSCLVVTCMSLLIEDSSLFLWYLSFRWVGCVLMKCKQLNWCREVMELVRIRVKPRCYHLVGNRLTIEVWWELEVHETSSSDLASLRCASMSEILADSAHADSKAVKRSCKWCVLLSISESGNCFMDIRTGFNFVSFISVDDVSMVESFSMMLV